MTEVEVDIPVSAYHERMRKLFRRHHVAITRDDLRGDGPVGDDLDASSAFILLYRQYLRDRWDVFDLDFRQDRHDWSLALTAEERESFLGIAASFLHGSRQLEVDLAEFMAGTAEEHKLHVAAQIETQARHTAFFGRFLCEVVDLEPTADATILDRTFPLVQETFVGPFGLLAFQAEELRRNPHDQRARVRYGTTCFLWIQGVLAASFSSVLLGFAAGRGMLPAFVAGARAMYLDHARHVRGGLLFLQQELRRDPTVVDDIYATLRTILMVSAVSSRQAFHEPLGWSGDEIRLLVSSSLRRKCTDLGITLPAELEALLLPISGQV